MSTITYFIGGSLSCTPVSKVDSPSVGIAQVANVVNEVYGSANTSSQNSTFPLQQKLIVCTLLLMLKTSKLKELTLGKVRMCNLYLLWPAMNQ